MQAQKNGKIANKLPKSKNNQISNICTIDITQKERHRNNTNDDIK